MSSFLAKSSFTTVARATNATRQHAPIRSFHSPFRILNQQSKQQTEAQTAPFTYEKQYDFSYEPLTTSFGNHTYVVSQPDASASHYEVPSGAYPTSSPYVNYAPAEAPKYNGAQVSSTSTNLLAHEFLMRAVPSHFGGVGASSAIRYATAPGEMGEMGGSFGGAGMMDWKGFTPPREGGLRFGERNPPPDGKAVAEMFSKAGVDEAWRLRR